MASKGRNASLRNAMHRHPQMVEKSVYFAGQDENSSNTYLRWLGSFWESMNDGSAMAGVERWKRKYLPVGLANGAAGNHPGYGCKWDHFGGSAEYVNFYDWQTGDIIPYSTTNESAFGGISGEHPYNVARNPDSLIDYKKYDMPSEAGITYSNAGYNDQWPQDNRTCRFKWPFGEYRPVFADARPWATDVNGIPVQLYDNGIYYDDGVATHSGPWRIKDDDGNNSHFHLPVHYEAGEWISIVDSQSPLTSSLNGDPYKLDNNDYIGDWGRDNVNNGTHPVGFDEAIYNPVEFQKDGDIHFRFYPNAWSLQNENSVTGITGNSDQEVFSKVHSAMFGLNPNYLDQNILDIKVFSNQGILLFRAHTYFDKLDWQSFDVVVRHEDWTVTTGTLPNTDSGWWGSGGGNYHWGENPKIQVQVKNESGQDWTHYPPNDNLLDWKQESSYDVDQYDNTGRVERDEDHIQVGLDYKPEIRTPTRSVLLYDLAGAIPAGAPLMKAELFLTSMGRWNWPNEDRAPDWTTNETVLNGPTGPRRLKVGKGAQYQISQLHPSTTKEATWGTYDGTNPWTDLTEGLVHGATCSILPNVFNMGGGESSYKYFGMGWKFDQNINGYPWHNHPERQIADTNSLREWMSFEKYEDYEPPEDYWTNTAVRGPSEEEHRGITGGGVMVVPSNTNPLASDDSTPPGPGNFTQNEIYELTGRRARDVIDFNISNDAGSTTCIDVTSYARDAIYNMGGKLRLAITGKTITGNAQDPGDIYKSESSWSHYAYQYNNDYPYGGGTRQYDFATGQDVDTPGPDAQHPYCGPHTIKTEFYSLSDDSDSEDFQNLSFSNVLGESAYGDVLDMTDLVTRWQDILVQAAEGDDGTDDALYDVRDAYAAILMNNNAGNGAGGEIYIMFRLKLASGTPMNDPGVLEWIDWFIDAHAMAEELENHIGNKIKIVCPKIEGANGEIVTIGEDNTGTDSESIGYVMHSADAGLQTQNDGTFKQIHLILYFRHPDGSYGEDIPADAKTLIRHWASGENYFPVDTSDSISEFQGYFTGDLGDETPTLGVGSGYASSWTNKFDEIVSPPSNYISSITNSFPVYQEGDLFGITHGIPVGATHDNRGTYTVKNIITPKVIEVNEDVTTESIATGGPYETITATNFSNRPYLKLTYSEQEAYGV